MARRLIPHLGAMHLAACVMIMGATTQTIHVKLFTGTYFDPQPDMIAYESAIPMAFEIRLCHTLPHAKFPSMSRDFCDLNHKTKTEQTKPNNDMFSAYSRGGERRKDYCTYQNEISKLHHMIGQQLQQQHFDPPGSVGSRKRRSLTFVAKILNWCCDLATVSQVDTLHGNQEKMANFSSIIRDQVHQDHGDLVLTSEHLNDFAKNTHVFANKVHESLIYLRDELDKVNETEAQLLKQLYLLSAENLRFVFYNFYFDNMRQARLECSRHNIPRHLVTEEKLQAELKKLQEILAKKRLQLAIDPTTNLDHYYKLRLIACKFLPEHISVMVKIPLRRRGTEPQVFRHVPTPLLWNNEICYLSTGKHIIVRRSPNDAQLIDENDDGCNEASRPLCKLSRIRTNNPQEVCLLSLLDKSDSSSIKERCHFTCYPAKNHTVITKLTTNKYLVTHIRSEVIVSCPGKAIQKHYKGAIGSIELILPCDCTLNEEGQILIETQQPCDVSDHNGSSAIHILPLSWTNLSSVSISPIDQEPRQNFHRANDIIDLNWTLAQPTYLHPGPLKRGFHRNITLDSPIEPPYEWTPVVIYILLAWCSLTTLILAVLSYISHVHSIKISLLSPSVPQN